MAAVAGGGLDPGSPLTLQGAVLGLLLSHPGGVPLRDFGRLFHQHHGRRLDLPRHSYRSLCHLLGDMKELVVLDEEGKEPWVRCRCPACNLLPEATPPKRRLHHPQVHKEALLEWQLPEAPKSEPSYPKPSISLRPSGGVSLGEAVTIQCCGQHQGMQFVLNKDGRPVQSVNSDYLALFHINNLSWEHGGSYSCSYHNQSEPSAVSDPSDPMELVVRDPSLPRPSIALNLTAPGADATIRCQGQRQDVSFFLHKAGDLNPQQRMDPAGAGAEFRIPTVGREHGGNYSCSYQPWSEPFVSSQPSDTVQLVVAGGTDPTQPGAAPAPTRPDSEGPGSGPLVLTWAIIAGVSAAAAGLLLLLLVAFLCFRKIRARRGAAPRPSSTSPMTALKVLAQEYYSDESSDEEEELRIPPPDFDPEDTELTDA